MSIVESYQYPNIHPLVPFVSVMRRRRELEEKAARPKIPTRTSKPKEAKPDRKSSKKMAVKVAKSDTPTIAIAPPDYEHLFSLGKQAGATKPGSRKAGPAVRPVKSDTPTVAIAPSDYAHIFQAGKVNEEAVKPKVDTRGKPIKGEDPLPLPSRKASRRNKNTPAQTAPEVQPVKSDTTTVAIAPSDYAHIYQAGKVNEEAVKPKVDTRGRPIEQEEADEPPPQRERSTRQMRSQSPSRRDRSQTKTIAPPMPPPVGPVKSDTPTVAIAPSDYQHLYNADKDENKPAKPVVDTRGNPVGPVKSDTPTVAIAPSDYQHIYQAGQGEEAAKPKVDTRGKPLVEDEPPPVREGSARRVRQETSVPPVREGSAQRFRPDSEAPRFDQDTDEAPIRHVKSDTPTVAIAPSDYQHIYQAGQGEEVAKPKVDTRGRPLEEEPQPTRERSAGRVPVEEAVPTRERSARRIKEEAGKRPDDINEDGISNAVISMIKAFIDSQPKKYYLKKRDVHRGRSSQRDN